MMDCQLPKPQPSQEEMLCNELNEQIDTYGFRLFMKCALQVLSANLFKVQED